MAGSKKRPLGESLIRELRRARKRYLTPFLKNASASVVRWFPYSARNRRQAARLQATRRAFLATPIAREKDTFLLVRIIGNDLEPRHRKGQSFDNVQFILDNGPELEDCDKFWIVNRITDLEEERRIIELLERRGQSFVRVPYDPDAYRLIDWDLGRLEPEQLRFSGAFEKQDVTLQLRYEALVRRPKNLYVMNNNGARNLALDIGRARAKWVMPWDGNCFLTASAFAQLRDAVGQKPYLPYVIVPMARIVDNDLLQDPSFIPKAEEEPQIVFRKDTTNRFNEEFPYGRRPKIEMLWRLGVPGAWDNFRMQVWDFPRPSPAQDAGLFHHAGWVARLSSGRMEQEVGRAGFRARSISRDEAIVTRIDQCDAAAVANALDPSRLVFYDQEALSRLAADAADPVREHIRLAAEEALKRGPYSVIDKTEIGPGGDPHDYFHPAPYWWPDPATPSGLPYILRDGERVPGTELYAPGSEKFDRTRLQRLFDDSTALALAATVFGDRRYALHAAGLIRTWFLDTRTRMNPHLKYAQVRAGHRGEKGGSQGIIEFKDIYFFLDAVRLIERTGALTASECGAFRVWLTSYADWLDTSAHAKREFRRNNNHGTFYDVQRTAIAAFLGDSATMARYRLYARERLAGQVAADGSLPAELTRTRPLHYVMFSLQGWTTLARILSSAGDDLWSHRTTAGQGIGSALNWLAANYDRADWAVDKAEVDPDRLAPLLIDLANHHAPPDGGGGTIGSPKLVFHPDEAIAPYWRLRRP